MNFGQWIGFIILIIALYILWNIRQLILLLFAAAVLATSLNFLVQQLQIWVEKLALKLDKKWEIKRGYAVFLSIIVFLTAFFGFILLIVPPFVTQLDELIKLLPQGLHKLSLIIYATKQNLPPILRDSLPDLSEIIAKLQPIINQVVNSGWTVIFSSIGAVLNGLLLLVLTLMFLADPNSYTQVFMRLFPSFYRPRVKEILNICEFYLEDLIARILINILVVSVGSYLVLLILGIPLPLAQGMLAGILTFIPYIGSAIGLMFPVLISLVDSAWKWLLVIILYLLIFQVKRNIILPKLGYPNNLILPVIMLLSQLFFTTFFGIMGLLIALPLTVIAQILFQEIIINDILNKWE